MKSLKFFLLSVFLLFNLGIALSQEEALREAVNLDENIQPGDLEISEPRLLPDNPFYFLKNLVRKIQDFFTLHPIKKIELRMKFTNEKLMEMKKMIEKREDPEMLKRGIENYQGELEKIKNQVEKIKERARENPYLESFLDKFIHQQILHQKLLQRLETQVPPQVFEKIKECRERHLERFGEVMTRIEDRWNVLQEKLEKITEEQKGSKFKDFKNLEILKNLEEEVGEEAKEAIQKAQEKVLMRLQGALKKMSLEDQESFKEYVERISGEKEKHLEILENLKSEIRAIPAPPESLKILEEKMEEGKVKILERIEKKLEKLKCPLWVSPAPGFCKEGRVIIEKEAETGCPLPPRCIIPAEIEIPKPVLPILPEKPKVEKPEIVCITLWNPVCGIDGKTYSNACFALSAGVAIAYKGECKEKECQTDADCQPLRCGQAGIRCEGVRSKCIEGKCQIVPAEIPIPPEKPVPERPAPERPAPERPAPLPGIGCKDLCGDGICQEVVCLAIGCPCPETPETCPKDCKK